MKAKIVQATVAGQFNSETDEIKTDSVGEFRLHDIADASDLGDLRGTTMIIIFLDGDDDERLFS